MAAYNRVLSTEASREETTEAQALSRIFAMVLGLSSSTDTASENLGYYSNNTDTAKNQEEDIPLAIDNNTGDLIVWLDGSDVNGDGTLFQGRPEVWEDKSWHGNSAIQIVPDKRPILMSSPSSGDKTVVRFDKERGDFMTIDFSDLPDSASEYTVFAVIEEYHSDLVVTESLSIILVVSTTNRIEDPYVISVDGKGVFSDHAGFSCDIAEFIVFNRVLTEAEQRKITSYLSGKWGIAQ